MDYEAWGGAIPNPQGTEIALTIDKHVYLMELDGNNLVQVTGSNDQEAHPVFSPDGRGSIGAQ